MKTKEEPNQEFTDLERVIVKQINESIGEAVKSRLSQGYADTPLNKLIDRVISSRLVVLEEKLNTAMDGAISTGLSVALNEAFNPNL